MNQLAEDLPGRRVTSSDSSDTGATKVKTNVKVESLGPTSRGPITGVARYLQAIQGQEEQNVHLKQSGWCRYVGQAVSQPCNIWLAALSRAAADKERQQRQQEQLHRQKPQLHEPDRHHAYDLLHQAQLRVAAPSYSCPQQPARSSSQHKLVSCGPGANVDSWSNIHEQHGPLMSDQSAQELADLLGVNSADDRMGMHPGSASGLRIADWQQQARPEFQHMPIPTFPANPGSSTNHFSNTGMAYNDMRSLSPVCSTRHMYRQDQGSPCIMQHGSGNPGAAGMQQQQAAQPLLAEQYWPQEYNVTHNHTEPLPSRLYMPMQGQPGSNNLGMGQHAMAAAAGDAFLQPSSAQQTHPQSWLPAMQLSNARNMSPYLHQSSDLPLQHQVPSGSTHQHAVYQSADLDASRRSHSEDMTRFPSLGTSVYSNRTGSGGLTVSQRDMVGPAVASPQSSRSSSLPSMSPHLPIAQGHHMGSTNQIMPYQGATQPGLSKLLIQLVTAPAMFSGPLCPGKKLDPPFRVRVAVLAESCIQLQLTLKAYVLSKDHLTSLEQWQPAQHTVTEGVAGGEVQQTISCTEPGFGNGEGSAELMGGTSDFVFSDLRFSHSSRMKPRWLAIAATLPTQDVMFVLYNVPTIIMSRACDQVEKAMGILKGAEQQVVSKKRMRNSTSSQAEALIKEDASGRYLPSVPSSSSTSDDTDNGLSWSLTGPFTYRRWHRMVEKKYNAYNLVRALNPEDLDMMEKMAGFHSQARKPSADLTERQWAYFGEWYLSYLRIFRCHQQLWMMEQPQAICGFGIDRIRAEQMLAGHPLGTFLVRPGLALARCMVISAVIEGGIIKHLALDGSQLDATTLETWVKSVSEAQELLDYKTGQRYNKAKVFCVHYQPFGVVSDDNSQRAQSVS